MTDDKIPAPGTTRYTCPLECNWHYDVPPPDISRISELGVRVDPSAHNLPEAINWLATGACLAEAERTEGAVRRHLASHTSPAEVAAIERLLADAGLSGVNWRP
ncbi:hypothetical protein [Streptomyces sp. NPDC060188]|uniref:hypothetical protein n=1 Tax=Streptomyces sp. NPDC060188 TaxID=3347068 RepID=UPI0036688958